MEGSRDLPGHGLLPQTLALGSGLGPGGIGDATTFRVGDGWGGLTQGGSASPEPWRFDPGLDYETPFGVTGWAGPSQ